MAELTPGLQQPPVGPPQAGPQPAGLPPPPSGLPLVAPPNPVGEEKTREDPNWDKYAAEKARLRAIQADLLSKMEERSKPSPMEFWSSMARGFGDPNNKSFASGAAGFAGNLQASNEAQRGREMEMYKMRVEMAKQQLEDTGSDIVAKQLFGPAGGEGFAPVAQAVGISPAQAQQLPPELKKSMMLQWFSGDRKGAVDTFAKYTLENAKTPDEIKVARQLSGMFPGADPNTMMQFFARTKLLGDPVQIMTEIRNITKQMDAEELSRPTGNAMIAMLQSRLNAGNPQQPTAAAPAAPVAPAAAAPVAPAIKLPIPVSAVIPATQPTPAAAAPTASAFDANVIKNAPANTSTGQIPKGASLEDASRIINSSIPDPDIRRILLEDYRKGIAKPLMPVMTSMLGSAVEPAKMASTGEGPNKRERAILEAEQTEEAVGKAKERGKDRSMFKLGFDTASDNLAISDQVYAIVSNNPNAFGILSKPGFGAALGSLVQDAVRIGTYSIGIPGIQDAIRKIGGTQADIDAVSKFDQLAVNLALAIATTQKGLGSITNYEREQFAKAAFSSNDSANVLLYKSELLRARSTFDKVRWQQYYEFERSKSGNIEDYKMSPSYQALRNKYEATLKQIAKTYQK